MEATLTDMEKHRKITDNTVADMRRFGWVVLDYDHMDDAWIGKDHGGNKWSVEPHRFGSGLQWVDFGCDDRWYRCCKPAELHRFGAEMLPARNVGDPRN